MPRPYVLLALLIAPLAGCLEQPQRAEGGDTSVVEAYSIAQVSGRGFAGLPIVPLRLSPDGALEGKPEAVVEGVSYDVLAWHRYCGRSDWGVLQRGYSADERLYYIEEANGTSSTNRSGQPVRPDDLRPGETFRARWRSGGGEVDQLVVRGIKLPEQVRGDPWDDLAVDNIIVFDDRSTRFCTSVVPFQRGDGFEEASVLRGVDNRTLFLDLVHGGVWNAAWPIRDLVSPAVPLLHPPPAE